MNRRRRAALALAAGPFLASRAAMGPARAEGRAGSVAGVGPAASGAAEAAPGAAEPTRVGAVAADEALWPVEVARGVFVLRGSGGEVEAVNRGRVGNAGFVVGPRGVIAVDSGVSRRHGEALLAAIASVTDRPVRRLVLTHARQEFVFGAAAFQAAGIRVDMQREAATLMAQRCGTCLERLVTQLGADEMQGTRLVVPDAVFAADLTLHPGGRPLRLMSFGHSSGPGDTAVLDLATHTLFAGGLLDARQVPDVQDADLAGWRRALRGLAALRPATVVPGHGPPAPARLAYTVERYLTQLERRVRALLAANAALSEVPDAVRLPEFEDWAGYDSTHRRNAALLFLRLEREAFER